MSGFIALSGPHIDKSVLGGILFPEELRSDGPPCVGRVPSAAHSLPPGPRYGDAFDHVAIEFEYANGARVQSFSRQVVGASSRVAERIVGTKGVSDPSRNIEGANAWSFSGEPVNSFRQEHVDLLRSIRESRPINQARRIAESTLTAIMGRVSASMGRAVSFN